MSDQIDVPIPEQLTLLARSHEESARRYETTASSLLHALNQSTVGWEDSEVSELQSFVGTLQLHFTRMEQWHAALRAGLESAREAYESNERWGKNQF